MGWPSVFFEGTLKTIAYIDCFNLYHSRLTGSPYQWLNLWELARKILRSENELTQVKCFTARSKFVPWDPQRVQRQEAYLSALNSVEKIEVIYGKFRVDEVRHYEWESYDRAIRGFSGSSKPVVVSVARAEEKGSDVNLACHLLHDAHTSRFEQAIVISNDSDLKCAIEMVTTSIGKPVGIVFPPSSRSKFSRELMKVATFQREIRESHLKRSLFPSSISIGNQVIRCPESWLNCP